MSPKTFDQWADWADRNRDDPHPGYQPTGPARKRPLAADGAETNPSVWLDPDKVMALLKGEKP